MRLDARNTTLPKRPSGEGVCYRHASISLKRYVAGTTSALYRFLQQETDSWLCFLLDFGHFFRYPSSNTLAAPLPARVMCIKGEFFYAPSLIASLPGHFWPSSRPIQLRANQFDRRNSFSAGGSGS